MWNSRFPLVLFTEDDALGTSHYSSDELRDQLLWGQKYEIHRSCEAQLSSALWKALVIDLTDLRLKAELIRTLNSLFCNSSNAVYRNR